MTVYEILVSRGKRKRMMAAKEDPFERVERQLRAAKRFRVEEYIRSLAAPATSTSATSEASHQGHAKVDDEDEQRRRYAFFFGGDRTVTGRSFSSATTNSTASASSSSSSSLSIVAASSQPRQTTVHPTHQPSMIATSVVHQHAYAPTTATAVPVTFSSPTHPAMRLHRMCESGGSPVAAATAAGLSPSLLSAHALRSLYPPSRPNILASASSTAVASPGSSPAATAALSSPVSSPSVVHSPRPTNSNTTSGEQAAQAACSCSHPPPPAAGGASPLRVASSASALRSSAPQRRSASPCPPAAAPASSACAKARMAPQTGVPASGMCD